MNIKFETERLILRTFMECDAIDVSYNSKQPNAAHFMSDMVLKTEEAALSWIQWINNDKIDISIPNVVLAIEQKTLKKCIGLIGVAPKKDLNNEIEILFSIADEYQNKGYVTEAGIALIDWIFKNTPATHLAAIAKHDNHSSNRVIKKIGFTFSGEREFDYDGKMTKFHYYRLEKNEAVVKPVYSEIYTLIQ